MSTEYPLGLDALERRQQQNAQHQGVQRHVAPGLGAADRRPAGHRRRQGGHQEVQQSRDMVIITDGCKKSARARGHFYRPRRRSLARPMPPAGLARRRTRHTGFSFPVGTFSVFFLAPFVCPPRSVPPWPGRVAPVSTLSPLSIYSFRLGSGTALVGGATLVAVLWRCAALVGDTVFRLGQSYVSAYAPSAGNTCSRRLFAPIRRTPTTTRASLRSLLLARRSTSTLPAADPGSSHNSGDDARCPHNPTLAHVSSLVPTEFD